MFELSVASKYLLPRWRQLSVSIISLISILVIALVVWLIVVFFSVTDGLEKTWTRKLTALTAPIRITPTDAYYRSYYYQVDTVSFASNYASKTIKEKLEASQTDPYDPTLDTEIPVFWSLPDKDPQDRLKDIVKLAYGAIHAIPDIRPQDFELTMSHIDLKLIRSVLPNQRFSTEATISYPAYVGNFQSDHPHLNDTLLPLRHQDVQNVLHLLNYQFDPSVEEPNPSQAPPLVFKQRLKTFFEGVNITSLSLPSQGWTLPLSFLKQETEWEAYAIHKNGHILRLIIPVTVGQKNAVQASLNQQHLDYLTGRLKIQKTGLTFTTVDNQTAITASIPLILMGSLNFPVEVIASSIEQAHRLEDVLFQGRFTIQGKTLTGLIPYRGLDIGAFTLLQETSPFWVYYESGRFILPHDAINGHAVLLPKSFKDAGVFVGDHGYLTYIMPTTSALLEQRLPIYVAGFYDPGIIPIGGKFILTDSDVLALIRPPQQEKGNTNGINVHFTDLERADQIKAELVQAFKKLGIERYWNIETYREYEFTKEIMQELHSQKSLFTLIAVVIIIVACSNIISMLIILVNDKKTEIGILRSMGASSTSIGLIFGIAGALIGIAGSVIGIIAAVATLHYLHFLMGLIGQWQGHAMFSSSFYGEKLPHELSYEALGFVIISTLLVSLLAGIVPAIKACLVRPSAILKATGEG
jgi:lipoprotein-releasing system permease protein